MLSPFIQRFYARWLRSDRPSEAVFLLGSGMAVGLLAGMGVWLFKRLIELAHTLFFGVIGAGLGWLDSWAMLLIPALGGLLVGLIVHYLIGEERHHGVAGVMEAAALAGGRLRYNRIPAKALASALSIGSGASVGPEDPSVQIGANIGSFFGQRMKMSDERVRTLVAAGAAGGIAAAFNAPIAGVFFALEIILGEISGSAFGVVVIAAVISAIFTQAVSGSEPAFHVPAYAFGAFWELPLYLILGLLAGPVAALYIRLLYFAQDVFNHIRLPRWLKPALAGLIVGAVSVFLPQILGVGYDTIGAILNGRVTAFWLLAALLAAKLILTPVSIGGGFPGGVFAPSLFIGAALGAAYADGLKYFFPGLTLAPGAFAMVGMAAVLAGAVHSPLTAVILLFEMTNDYRIILPLMFAVVVSLAVSQWLAHDSVYTLGLARKGVRLERGRDVDVLETITAAEVMQPAPLALNENQPLKQAADVLFENRHHGLPVQDDQGRLVGVLTVQDLAQMESEDEALRVGDACTRDLVTVYPDETIGVVLQRLSALDIGRAPVVARDDPRRMLGWLRRSDLMRAYEVALTRRAIKRHRIHQVRLGAFSGGNVRVIEMQVEPGAPCDGKKVKEIAWPSSCLLASVRKGRKVEIPHGDTELKAGYTLVIVVEGGQDEQAACLCKAGAPPDAEQG